MKEVNAGMLIDAKYTSHRTDPNRTKPNRTEPSQPNQTTAQSEFCSNNNNNNKKKWQRLLIPSYFPFFFSFGFFWIYLYLFIVLECLIAIADPNAVWKRNPYENFHEWIHPIGSSCVSGCERMGKAKLAFDDYQWWLNLIHKTCKVHRSHGCHRLPTAG